MDADDSSIHLDKKRKKEEKQARREQRRQSENRRRILRRATILAILIAVISLLGYGIYVLAVFPPTVGPVGSAHEHAVFTLFLDGEPLEIFHQPKYQLVDDRVHFEDGDGFLVHKHARGVTLGYLFETLSMQFNSTALILDDGRSFVSQSDKILKLYVNRVVNTQYERYEIKEGDRILLSYGNESQTEIDQQLDYVEVKAVERRIS